MSIETAGKLIDNSAKNPNLSVYRLGLLVRTVKSDDIIPNFVEHINRIDALCEIAPPQLAAVWKRYSDGFKLAMAGTSSKNGWLLDKLTTTTYHYKGDQEQVKGKGGLFSGKGSSNQVEI